MKNYRCLTMLILFMVLVSTNAVYAWTMDYTVLQQSGIDAYYHHDTNNGIALDGSAFAKTNLIYDEIKTEYVCSKSFIDLNFIISSDYANGPDTVSLYLSSYAFSSFPEATYYGNAIASYDCGFSYTLNGLHYDDDDFGTLITLSTDTVYNLSFYMYVEVYAEVFGVSNVLDENIAYAECDLILGYGPFFEYASEDSAPVPEPTTMLLLGTGLAGLAGIRRKKFKK